MSFKNKRVLVTGGAGFIGSRVVGRLISLGAEVQVLEAEGKQCNLAGTEKVVYAGMSDERIIEDTVLAYKPHYIFSLAAKLARDQSWELFSELFQVHVKNLEHLISAAGQAQELRRLVHVGTIDEYGKIEAPFKEADRENPQNPYALTKLMGSRLVEYAAKTGKIPAAVVRLALTYGPAQRRGMFVPDLIRSCIDGKEFSMTAGEQTRDFLYVDDAVEGILAVAAAQNVEGEIFNIGSGQPTKIRDAAEMIRRETGNACTINFGAIPYREDENMDYWLDKKKAADRLGWMPKISLVEGLRSTITWYKNNHSSR